jgi:hypothetical protein
MKTVIKIPKKYKPDEREAIAYEIIEKIVERTQKGLDKKGENFKGYSKSYMKSLDFQIAGKGKKPDLTLSGDMLAEMKLLKHKSGEIVIGYEKGSTENAKAEGNILGTYGQSSPIRGKKRDFLGASRDEMQKILSHFPTDDFESRRDRVAQVNTIISAAEEITGSIALDELEE